MGNPRIYTQEQRVIASINATKHGKSRTRIYKIYHGMKQRCENEKNPEYKNYGGRNINICDEWKGNDGFKSFYDWAMSHGYENDLTIERNNVNDGYNPHNCSWIAKAEQHKNRTDSHLITINGETKNIKEWSDIYGVSKSLIGARIDKLGWDNERAVTQPARKKESRYVNEQHLHDC